MFIYSDVNGSFLNDMIIKEINLLYLNFMLYVRNI